MSAPQPNQFENPVSAAQICKIYRQATAPAAKPVPAIALPPLAPELGIHKVTRRLAIGTVGSAGHGEDYGYVRISLAHVSLIDGPREQTVEVGR